MTDFKNLIISKEIIPGYPFILIILFSIFAVIIYIFGKFFFRHDYKKGTAQVNPFNSGNLEKIDHNVRASSLFWGFRQTMQLYYEKAAEFHEGDLNDYIKWIVIIIALCLLLVAGGFL